MSEMDPSLLTMIVSLLLLPWFLLQGRPTRKQRHQQILRRTAENEHEIGWVPHGDPDVHKACDICKEKEFGWKPKSEWSSTVLTPNEQRSMHKPKPKVLTSRNSKPSTGPIS